MLKELSFENIRGKSRNRKFFFEKGKQVIVVRGRNGEGKTSVADAISFAFTGSDSQGNPLPVHMISTSEDKLKVKIGIDDYVLERTLTRKKSQSTKFIKEGIPPIPMTQEDMTRTFCSKDTLLSSMIPGYFMSLPYERAISVLEEAVPRIDKMALLEKIVGHEIDSHLKGCLDLSKPSDLAATRLVIMRRGIEKANAENQGSINVYQSLKDPGEAPETPEIEMPESLLLQEARWEKYDSAVLRYKSQISRREAELAEEKLAKKRQDDLREELAQIPPDFKPIVVNPDLYKQRNELVKLIRSTSQVSFMELPSSDVCPTCGQTVGSKHRESIIALNDKRRAEYDAELMKIGEHNDAINTKIKEIDAEVERVSSEASRRTKVNALNAARRREIEAEIYKIRTPSVSPAPEEPVTPVCARPTKEEITKSSEVWKAYYTESTLHAQAVKNFSEASASIDKLQSEIENNNRLVSMIEEIEDGLVKLDKEVFDIMASNYDLGSGFSIINSIPGKGSVISVQDSSTGFSYGMFSTGEKSFVDILICVKLNKLLKSSPKIIFADNFDLVSKEVEFPEGMTFIAAQVTQGEFDIVEVG